MIIHYSGQRYSKPKVFSSIIKRRYLQVNKLWVNKQNLVTFIDLLKVFLRENCWHIFRRKATSKNHVHCWKGNRFKKGNFFEWKSYAKIARATFTFLILHMLNIFNVELCCLKSSEKAEFNYPQFDCTDTMTWKMQFYVKKHVKKYNLLSLIHITSINTCQALSNIKEKWQNISKKMNKLWITTKCNNSMNMHCAHLFCSVASMVPTKSYVVWTYLNVKSSKNFDFTCF